MTKLELKQNHLRFFTDYEIKCFYDSVVNFLIKNNNENYTELEDFLLLLEKEIKSRNLSN